MRIAAIAFLAALGFAACDGGGTATYHNAITGKSCKPDMATFAELHSKSKHPGCDAQKCCEIVDGECDHPDAGISVPNPP